MNIYFLISPSPNLYFLHSSKILRRTFLTKICFVHHTWELFKLVKHIIIQGESLLKTKLFISRDKDAFYILSQTKICSVGQPDSIANLHQDITVLVNLMTQIADKSPLLLKDKVIQLYIPSRVPQLHILCLIFINSKCNMTRCLLKGTKSNLQFKNRSGYNVHVICTC